MVRRSIQLRLDWDDKDPAYGFRVEAMRDRVGRSHSDLKIAIRELCRRHSDVLDGAFDFPVGKVLDVPFPICPTWDPNCGDPPDPEPPLMCYCKVRFTHRPIDSDPPPDVGGSGDQT